MRMYFGRKGNKTVCVIKSRGIEVKGVAVCDAQDTFDEEFGKELAKLRALSKMEQRIFERTVKTNMKMIYKIREENQKACKKVDRKKGEYDKLIETLLEKPN